MECLAQSLPGPSSAPLASMPLILAGKEGISGSLVTACWEHTSRLVFFSSPQKVLEGALAVIVTWPQAGATEVCSIAHPHTQS